MYSQQANGSLFFFLKPKPFAKKTQAENQRKLIANITTEKPVYHNEVSNYSKMDDILSIVDTIDEDNECEYDENMDDNKYNDDIDTKYDNMDDDDKDEPLNCDIILGPPPKLTKTNEEKEEKEEIEPLNCDIVLGAIPKVRPCFNGRGPRRRIDNQRRKKRKNSMNSDYLRRVSIRTDKNGRIIITDKKQSIADILIQQSKSKWHKTNFKNKQKKPKSNTDDNIQCIDETNGVYQDDILSQQEGWWVSEEYYDDDIDFEYSLQNIHTTQ